MQSFLPERCSTRLNLVSSRFESGSGFWNLSWAVGEGETGRLERSEKVPVQQNISRRCWENTLYMHLSLKVLSSSDSENVYCVMKVCGLHRSQLWSGEWDFRFFAILFRTLVASERDFNHVDYRNSFNFEREVFLWDAIDKMVNKWSLWNEIIWLFGEHKMNTTCTGLYLATWEIFELIEILSDARHNNCFKL